MAIFLGKTPSSSVKRVSRYLNQCAALGVVDPDAERFVASQGADMVLEIWPGMEDSIAVWSLMQTQWRPGATGLDYGALDHIEDCLGMDRETRYSVLIDLTRMQSAVHDWVQEQRNTVTQ